MRDILAIIALINVLILLLACLHFWRTRHEPERRTPRPNPWCATRKEPKP